MSLTTITTGIHLIAAIAWVGGMFFTYTSLRPASAQLPTEQRLTLWRDALGRFFGWVWICIAVLLLTGYADVAIRFGAIGQWPAYLHGMQDLGLVMIGLFTYLYFVPFRRLKARVAAGDLEGGAKALAGIRQVVAINLVLGMIVGFIGASGPFW